MASFIGQYDFWKPTDVPRFWCDYEFVSLHLAEEDREHLDLHDQAIHRVHWSEQRALTPKQRRVLARIQAQNPMPDPETVAKVRLLSAHPCAGRPATGLVVALRSQPPPASVGSRDRQTGTLKGAECSTLVRPT